MTGFHYIESILTQLAYAVEFMLSTWDSNTQFKLGYKLESVHLEKCERELASLAHGSLPTVAGSHLLNTYSIWLIQNINLNALIKCALCT